jgi:hypothetical protein
MIQRFCRKPTRAVPFMVTLLVKLVWLSVACKDQIVSVHEVPRHEDVWRNEDKASRIVNLVNRWRWMVSFTLHRLCRKSEGVASTYKKVYRHCCLGYKLWSSGPWPIILFTEFTELGRLCDLVVRVSGYRSRGPGYDSRRYQIF